jgi:subtilase family serine protease
MDRPHRVLAAGLAAALLLCLAATPAGAARSPRITFYFGLERPEDRARAAFSAVSRPGSPSYRKFLGVRQAARRYGASPRTIRALKRRARRHGFVARIDRSGVFARLTGTERAFERAFRVRIVSQIDNDVMARTWFVGRNRPLRVPRALRPLVREVVGTYARSAPIRRGGRGVARAAQAPGPPPGNAGTWTGGCNEARATGSYSFGQVRGAYGVDAAGSGAGASVALMNVGEGVPASDIRLGGQCFGLPLLRPRVLLTDGQARPFGFGSEEPQLDLAMVRGMAPGLRSLLLTQVWLTPDLWFLGPAQTLAAPSLPDTLSISYGICEREVRGRRAGQAARSNADLFDALLVRLGLAGVGVFAASGDSGSTCNDEDFPGVAWPASSPYLTAVGGTRLVLDAANARVDEVVWNDLPWVTAEDGGGAGGGGLSSASPRPPWQAGLPVAGRRRAAPDVAAHASLLPGWPVVLGDNWIEVGGTSAASPLVASALAVLSARERAAGRPPLGPVNWLLYSLPQANPGALFDIVSGNNAFDPKVPGINAVPGYDMASGLGVPRFDLLAAALPPAAP